MSAIRILRQVTTRCDGGMKRWPIVVAGTAGAITGFLRTYYVGMAMGLATSLTATATVILVVVCPPIYASWWNWWLIPILNAVLYGVIAFGIVTWRSRTRQDTRR